MVPQHPQIETEGDVDARLVLPYLAGIGIPPVVFGVNARFHSGSAGISGTE